MPLRFSLREHQTNLAWPPSFTFSKSGASIIRDTSSPNASIGTGYIFIVCDRAWLHGKYLRWNWQGGASSFREVHGVYIYDGEYDRTSDVDFPAGSSLLIKGNGLLQTVATQWWIFGPETKDIQINVSGGSEDKCTIMLRLGDSWASYNFLTQFDWIEFNTGPGGAGTLYDEQFTDAIIMEQTGTYGDYGYISTGDLPYYNASVNLTAGFTVAQWQADLPAKFDSGQDSADLFARFDGQITENLPGAFIPRRASSQPLLGVFNVMHSGDLKCVFRVTRIYDLRGTMGIAFYWWGTGEDPEIRVGFILESPTGFWMSSFYDGPARFRHVFLPWGSFIWVSLPEPDLDPHRHGFNEPDKSRIDGFYWTVHTPGVRRVDYIYAPVGGDLLAGFTIRKSASANLSVGFDVRHSDLTNLFAEFIVRQADLIELPAEFVSGQGRVNLLGQFDVGQDSEDLLCSFTTGAFFEELLASLFIYEGSELEDFEDATLVDHYQHSAGTGYRNAVFPHTGTWSWRTPQGSNDTFDLSDGQPITGVKIEAWTRYGNATLRFDLLDADLNIVKTLTWWWSGTYTLRTIEAQGVRYLKITCPAGVNSGLWTDDITIHWTSQTPTTRNLKAGFTVNHP